MFLKKPIPAAVIALSITAAGCGGGEENTVTLTPGSASGIVADGYLSGATVCLDLNLNKICDTGEPSATTGTGGAYTLDVTDETLLTQYPILVEVPATAIDEDTGAAVGKKFVLSAPAGSPEFISPLTTMVQNQIEANPDLTVDEAEDALITSMGKDPATISLFTDYVEAKNDTTDTALADDYNTLHNIAQVTARTLANNIETIEAAVNDGSVTLSLDEAFDALIQIVVEEVVAQLAVITANVETAEAASGDGSIDADAVTTSTDVSVDTTTVETEVAVVEATNSATTTTFEQQLADGFNWIWGEIESNWQELEYGTVTVVDGVASETQSSYNFTSGAFEVMTSSPDVYLGANGWTAGADDLSECSVVFNSDGSGTFTCLMEMFTVSSQEVDVTGLNVAAYLGNTDNGSFTSLIDSTAVFSSGAKAYVMSFTEDTASYELYTDSDYSVLNTGSTATRPTTLGGLLSSADWIDDDNSEPKAVWVGSKNSPEGCVAPEYASSSDTLCTLSQGMIVELVGSGTSGTANFYLTDYVNRNVTSNYHSVDKVAASTWSIQTVNGEEILSYETPASVTTSYSYLFEDEDEGQRIYSVYNNVVYEGEYIPAGSSDSGEVAFNNTAIADVINSITGGTDSTGGESTGTTSTSLSCSYESGWNDTTNQPIILNSYTDFETVVAACGGAQTLTTADMSGSIWADTWTESDGVVWVETLTFNSNGSVDWSEAADGVSQGSETGSWSVANNLITITATGLVDTIAITVDGAQKVYTEETDFGSDLTLDDTADGEIWTSGYVQQ